MADYYNKTRGPLAVTLSGGRTLVIPAKSWVSIATHDEGGESLSALVAHGDLHRSTVNTQVAPPRPAPAVPAPAPVPPAPVRAVAPPAPAPAPASSKVSSVLPASPPVGEPVREREPLFQMSTAGSPEAATDKRPDDRRRRRE